VSGHPSNAARGAWGERLAATHYRRLGYTVLARNWRCPIGELDLVLQRDDLFVFSEVKTRRDDSFGPPAAAVGAGKQRRIRLLAYEWLRTNDVYAIRIRFDVVAITGVKVHLIEDAF
jgi:putative endonuclease